MKLDDVLQGVREAVAVMPEPTVDAFHIRSDHEQAALREHVHSRPQPRVNPLAANPFGLPVYIVPDTPPGVLRAMLKGEVVEDVLIR